jgi:Ni,Fe-hydrogenase III large subunit
MLRVHFPDDAGAGKNAGRKGLEPVGSVEPYRFAFGLTEAPRGENIHFVMTGKTTPLPV